ncbi:hypothetical protein PIB30_067960 [Stylosanthes scabra]|uniref:GRF-type domain-containing protein n=1 Tax=Stylosanthes scabra TaxID=79078 RepID=A0ABU6QMQ7_9FABA|nr:hypothetical protein [Stylosanthes scabra]
MESDGGSSASRRAGGRGRGERSSSSTQGFFAAKVGHERAAPTCDCGVYVVLYLSKTANNPNKLFFECPFFKVKLKHCRFFLWLDEHVAMFRRVSNDEGVKEVDDSVDEHFARISIEKRISDLEDKLASMEKKDWMNWKTICLWIFVLLIAVFVGCRY